MIDIGKTIALAAAWSGQEEIEDTYNHFKSILEKKKNVINSLSLPELKSSLCEIDRKIESSEQISTVEYRALLDKKKIILERIQELSSNEKIETLHELVDQVSEGDIKQKLLEELNTLQVGAEKYKREIQDVAIQDIAARETEIQIKLEQQRIDGLERKSKIWLSFLQRESAASIVGAVVLILLTFSLIIGMVFGWESQVLSNGFLVILGYFFGQSSSRNNKDNDAGGNM